jgi:hypothetical protein
MSIWADCSRASDSDYLVGMALAYHAQLDTSLAWPKDTDIEHFARVSRRQVQRSLRALERLGEIIRQPDRGHRRLYLIAPGAPFQQPMFVGETATSGEFIALDGNRLAHQRLPLATASSPLRGRVEEPQRTEENRTPQPPSVDGGARPLPPSPFTSLPPGYATERAARSKSRRRADRRQRRSSAPGPCPLNAMTASEAEVLIAKAALEAELEARYGPDSRQVEYWRMHRKGAHLHALDPPVVLALSPLTWSYVKKEFRRPLAAIFGDGVSVVSCDALGGLR